jgi:LDH2 family malate/lactate/ureidoglycolate dehydrogenase
VISKLPAERLRQFARVCLAACGVDAGDARLVAASVVEAELEGQGSHGLIRLPMYCRRLRSGLIDPAASPVVIRETGSTATLDARNCLGPVSARRAVELAVAKATATGAGICAVRNGNHLGALAFHLREPARESGCFLLGFSNSAPGLAPPGGSRPMLGTNPIAAAIPTGGEPVVVDMATSQVARGRVMKAMRLGQAIPADWAADSAGRPTTDPAAAIAGWMLPMGGPKGFALALLVEALTGVLADSGVGPEVGGNYVQNDRPGRVGHCFVAINPLAFGDGFAGRMDRLVADIKAVEPVDPVQPVRVPGDRRRVERSERELDGVELAPEVVEELNLLAIELGVEPLTVPAG